MKITTCLVILAIVHVSSTTETCKGNVVEKCNSIKDMLTTTCTALYGAYKSHVKGIQALINEHIDQSLHYMLMASYFGNYEANRMGFQKYFQSLSDALWQDAFSLVDYNNRRGGTLEILDSDYPGLEAKMPEVSYSMNELEAMGTALDMHKRLAVMTQKLHFQASLNDPNYQDAELAAFLEANFVQRHAHKVRELAGHVSDLDKMIRRAEQSLAVYLFDQFIQ